MVLLYSVCGNRERKLSFFKENYAFITPCLYSACVVVTEEVISLQCSVSVSSASRLASLESVFWGDDRPGLNNSCDKAVVQSDWQAERNHPTVMFGNSSCLTIIIVTFE